MDNKNKSLWLYGIHPLATLLPRQPEQFTRLWYCKDDAPRIAELKMLCQQYGIVCEAVSEAAIIRQVGEVLHQGVIAQYRPKPLPGLADLSDLIEKLSVESQEPPFWLLLDHLQDPHNFGACLRSAAAFGVHGVIFPKYDSAPLTATVYKTASGAIGALPLVQVNNLAQSMETLTGLGMELWGFAGEAAENFSQLDDFQRPLGLVLGSEGEGLRALTRKRCQRLVAIPLAESIESLNVSTATAIAVYSVRQGRR